MLYLIGGPPRLGKSIIARTLARALRIPWMSTDFFEIATAAILPPAERKKVFPYTTMRLKDPYWRIPAEKAVRLQLVQARRTWKMPRAFIIRLLEGHEDFILEGTTLLPELIARLRPNPLARGNLTTLLFLDRDLNHIQKGVRTSIRADDWLRNASEPIYDRVARFIWLLNKKLERDARRHRVPIVMRTGRFSEDIRRAIALLRTRR